MSTVGAEACYRHPNRPSWVLCQRCGRTICPQCQTQASVGVQCPECIAEARAATKATHTATRKAHGMPTGVRRWLGRPRAVTVTLVIVTFAVGIAQVLTGGFVTQLLAFQADVAVAQPWRLVTVALVHGSILHILFNMYALWMLGPPLEERFGKGPFLAAYLVMAAAGSVAVPLLGSSSWVVGASGAIFGLFGMYIGVQKMLGGINPSLLIIVGINLVLGFVLGGIAWQAHIGGLVAGFLLGYGITAVASKRPFGTETSTAWMLIGGVGALVVVLWVALVTRLM